MVKLLDNFGSVWVPKCACGATQYERNFGLCQHPFYNEHLKILMCEKCLSPVYMGLVNPDDIKGSPELQSVLQKHAFSLFSDAHLIGNLNELKDSYEPEKGGETLADLGFTFEEEGNE